MEQNCQRNFNKMSNIRVEGVLVCREAGKSTNWLYWQDKLVDMKYLLARKNL